MFPMLAWAIGLVLHAWDVYWHKPISEEQIRQEMERMAWSSGSRWRVSDGEVDANLDSRPDG